MRRNIGSRITRAAAQHADNASLGNQAPRAVVRPATKGYRPGNSAGYKAERSARLEHSQGGYYNPRNQTARHTRSNILSNMPQVSFGQVSRPLPATMLDTRLTRFKDSSAGRISRLV